MHQNVLGCFMLTSLLVDGRQLNQNRFCSGGLKLSTEFLTLANASITFLVEDFRVMFLLDEGIGTQTTNSPPSFSGNLQRGNHNFSAKLSLVGKVPSILFIIPIARFFSKKPIHDLCELWKFQPLFH